VHKYLNTLVAVLLALGFLGASPTAGAAIDPNKARINLEGIWKFKTGESPKNGDRFVYADPATSTDGWEDIYAPKEWGEAGYGTYDGEAWYRLRLTVPADFNGIPLIAMMGYIDDIDQVYLNGVLIGQTGVFPYNGVSHWPDFRQYSIPTNLIKYGKTNTIAVRVYDATGGGGISKGPLALVSKEALRTEILGFPTYPASAGQRQRTLEVLARQTSALKNRNIPNFMATLDSSFIHDGYSRSRLGKQLSAWAKQYDSLQLINRRAEVLTGNNRIIVDTVRGLAGISADGKKTILVAERRDFRYFKQRADGTIVEVGNRSRFFEDSFFSPILREYRSLAVYVPPSYWNSPSRHYPTVYMLHGFNGSAGEWFNREFDTVLDNLIANGLMAEMIVIMPDADNSWYINSPPGTTPVRNYQDMIVGDAQGKKGMLQFVDANYRTIPDRRQRGLSGVSMGGFGAFNIGLNHPELFSSIASHMGALNFPGCTSRTPEGAAYCENQIPTQMVARMTTEQLAPFAFYFDAGYQDDFGFGAAATQMSALLTAKQVYHHCQLRPGKHNDTFWVPFAHQSFGMHTRNFAGQRVHGALGCTG
jgi:enterochelin esterase-like enzyme